MKTGDVRKLLAILNKYTEHPFRYPDVPWSHGTEQQCQRVMQVADWCAGQWPGDLVEVTCQVGEMTCSLAAVARKHGRRVKALMLWGKEAANWNCPDTTHTRDMQKVKPYWDIVDVVAGRERWDGPPLCFAFVNSMNDYRAYMNDIGMVSHCAGVIAVDDTLWQVEVDKAFLAMCHELGRGALQHPLCREGYLLSK
jgi:hypothetical protein